MELTKSRKAVFNSLSVEWPTPQKLFDELDAEFHFDLDVAASKRNAKCVEFYTAADNGLLKPWAGKAWAKPTVCFCNPPYGPDLKKWIAKAYQESELGATVVCLVPARTDTIWFHSYALKADEIRFLRGRLRFGDGKGRATFPSMVVVFRGGRKVNRSRTDVPKARG